MLSLCRLRSGTLVSKRTGFECTLCHFLTVYVLLDKLFPKLLSLSGKRKNNTAHLIRWGINCDNASDNAYFLLLSTSTYHGVIL